MAAAVKDVVQEIGEEIRDKSFGALRILRLVNRAQHYFAMGHFPQLPGVAEISLPTLETTGTVTTVASTAFAALPTNFMKDLHSCYSSKGDRECGIFDSLELLKAVTEPNLDQAGTVHAVARVGSNLYYQGISATVDTLTIGYFRKPTDLEANDNITIIPEAYAVDLFKFYVLANLPKPMLPDLKFDPRPELNDRLMSLARDSLHARKPVRVIPSMDRLLGWHDNINDIRRYGY